MATLVEHADALREIITDLSLLTLQQIAALFTASGDRDREELRALLAVALPEILGPPTQAAATIAAQWYDELEPESDYRATPVVDLDQPKIDGTTRWALYAPGDADPLDRIGGAAKRWVADAARDTIIENATTEGVRYARHAAPDACAFCRMLATRGAVYRSAESTIKVVGRSTNLTDADRRMRAAGLATTDELLERRSTYSRGERKGQAKVGALRGERELGGKYHDHCRCLPVAVRSGDAYEPPEYTQQWERDYEAAVKAAQAAQKTKGEYGAIDAKAVLSFMRKDTDAH